MEQYNFNEYAFDRNLILSGPTGVGKTFIAKKLFAKYTNPEVNKKLEKFWISDAKLKQLVKSNQLKMRSPDEYNIDLQHFPLELMIRAQVLVYDDIWVSDVSEAYLRDFTFILDERADRWLTTIFTTNLKREELETKLNQRVVSRMLHNWDVVALSGPDRRKENTRIFKYSIDFENK